jgi:hypothetical protein
MEDVLIDSAAHASAGLWAELWHSLASLLRSYTSAHGLHSGRTADIEWDEARIVAHHGEKFLNLHREGPRVTWMRENGDSGTLELTEAGRLRGVTKNATGEEEMDMAAEMWARELMQ